MKNERRNKTVVALVLGFDFLLLLMAIFGLINPDIKPIHSVHGFVNHAQEFVAFVRAIIFVSVMLGVTLGLGVLYKFLANSRYLISMYHACVVNICVTVLMLIALGIHQGFFGLIMVFLTVFIMYWGYVQTKIETITAVKEREANK